MPSAKRSGLSATVGLALVVGLLLVAGTLAVSGGGILSTGGRLGVDAPASPSPAPAIDGSLPDDGSTVDAGVTDGGTETPATGNTVGTKLEYTCDAGAIKDLGRGKWFMNPFTAGSRASDGYDQVTFSFSRRGGSKAKNATVVRLDWMDPTEARSKYGAPNRVQGSRALVLTFNGPDITVNQVVDSLQLEGEGVEQLRNIQMFEGTDGNVHAVAGLRSDSCAQLVAKGWSKKSKGKNSKVLLQVERGS